MQVNSVVRRRDVPWFERKARDARAAAHAHIGDMTDESIRDPDPDLDPEPAWAAVLARDRRADGRFITGVLSTGIYCRPSCAARHPKRANVRFFVDGAAARAAGLRPCLRCRPDCIARDADAVARAIALITASETPPTLDALATVAGYAPHHFHRLFRRLTGVTPAAYARGLRASRAGEALSKGLSVTDALYEAGYAAPSRFYAEAPDRLGMTPSVWARGGAGATIRWTVARTSLGAMLVAASARGICRLAFGEAEADLRRHFPRATIEQGGNALDRIVAQAVAAVERPAAMPELALDIRGTAFQEAVWQQLKRIPPGQTLSYAALAARAGRPGAARAAGTACGVNPVAVLVPCHRAQRGDGSLGGYAYGLPIKQALLAREAE